MGIEFQCDKTKRVLEMEFMLAPLNCTLKTVKMVNFVIYIFTQLKNWENKPSKKMTTPSISKDAEKPDHSNTAGNVKWYNNSGKQLHNFL